MKLHSAAFLVLFLMPSLAFTQGSFDYRRQIRGIEKNDWYSISVPADMYKNVNRDFSDVRIYSFAGKDTTEVPYVLKIMSDDSREEVYELPVLNTSRRDGALFLTFELEKNQKVNSIDLAFQQENFFAFAKLEGSHDQKSWFEITDKQRLLSIKNQDANLKVQSISFPVSQYRFLRATVTSDTKLTFLDATLRHMQVTKGSYVEASASFSTREDRKRKETIVDVRLNNFVPVSHFEIDVAADGDFYRAFNIEYVTDSTSTPRGWIRNYETFYTGFLTSYTPNVFDVTYDLTRDIRITIRNLDNVPLTVKNVRVSGPEVKVVAKLSNTETYVYYGNRNSNPPSYDIRYFEEKIPASMATVVVGPEEIVKEPVAKQSPLFENQLWLWVVMVVVIAVLGFVTLRMMRGKPQEA
jgi:hypothetical protein